MAALLYSIEYFYVSHRGDGRRKNRDNYVCGRLFLPADHGDSPLSFHRTVVPDEPLLLAVFDGSGGEAGGINASFIAASTFHDWEFPKREESLVEACRESSRRIARFARENRMAPCGSTAAMLLFDSFGVVRCNIGDSRIYRITDDSVRMLSETDTFPGGRRRRRHLLQYLGIPESEMLIQPHTEAYAIEGGERFLICTDGLSDSVSEELMGNAVRGAPTEEAGAALLRYALDSGWKDSITFFLVRVRAAER